ncbi:MAG: GNAT family N-acetyltransferase [Burkholderiales bacterium]|nr:GNAT family N-acetyltransferase [Burkholderiales bacterium]
MINWFKRTFEQSSDLNRATAEEILRCDGFQEASSEDAQFIFDSILSEISNGHFSSNYLLPLAQRGLIHQIETSIQSRHSITHRGKCESIIYIFLSGNCPIGFSWVVETEKTGERELYMLAVSPNHRNKGIGKALILHTIAQFPSKTKFFARLYFSSLIMLRTLRAMGFKRGIKQGKKTVWLSYVSD